MRSTFATQVKDELVRLDVEDEHCRRAELGALVRTCGTLYLKGKGALELKLSTLHAGCARRVFRMLRELFGIRAQVMVQRRPRLNREIVYVTRIPDQPALKKLVSELRILEGARLSYRISGDLVQESCCQAAYLRGCFLGAGSLTHPDGQHHLELSFVNEEFARDVADLMLKHGIPARVTSRGARWLVYLKESEAIVDFLKLTGAYNAVFAYEEVRIYKELRNQVNRLVNAETANVTKSVHAALRQIEAIRTIDRHIGIESLKPPLREVAAARLAHPELSLRDLGRQLDPPLGKSTVNYRMRTLQQLADRLERGTPG